ncbi:MAG TPA: glycosyl hydrolase [Chitinophagaceae bacterium]|nr:glycosyl hydrolase [Chitinophagaceae bacterium]
MIRQLFTIGLCCLLWEANAQVEWPATSMQTRPWTRWWWIGSAVNAKGITWNLQQYKDAGLGGVELTPIYGVYGYEKQFLDFLSPEWMRAFRHTLMEARRMGLGVDLANGTGWPFGGPWVTDDNASKTVYHKTYTVNAGESLAELIEYRRDALVRTANNKPAGIDTILQPVYINKNLQALALDQVQYPGKLPLQVVMAYGSNGEALDLTKNVHASGKLGWTAPQGSGKWTVLALFSGLHGKMVERAAPGGEGYAIDHFSEKASADYFKRFDEAFKGYDIAYLRAFFNDSYEVDDARGQSNWTPQLFAEFKKRKGYELKNYLHALFGKADADLNSRVLYDYRSVMDELLLEHFTEAWKKWGTTKGAMVRNQSHGSPANTLDLYSAVDIPETEGNDILRFKFATSAANVTGKPLVSSESATWLDEHFLSSWGDVKKSIDLYFLGGVNHIFYHGTAYSPREAAWPGWLFYAAVHFQPANPQWNDFKTLNDYITRTQSFLQAGKPDNDVLLYYPIIDRYSQTGGELLQHFDGMERNFVGTDFEHVSKWMLENGYSFDFFSDRQLQNMTMSGNKITSAGNTYQAILLPANKYISETSMQKLLALAKAGARVIVYKALPSDVPGFGQLEERRKLFRQASVEAGNIFQVSADLDDAFAKAKVRKEKFVQKGLQFVRRKNADGTMYFINNRGNEAFDGWVLLQTGANAVALFDAMNNKKGLAQWRTAPGGIEVRLQVPAFESVIVRAYNAKKTGASFVYYEQSTGARALTGDWSVEFLSGGPTLPAKRTVSELGSWTELEGEDVKNFSGTVKYSHDFPKPDGDTKHYLLDLGKVHATARVVLNGKAVDTLIGPTYQTVIPASMMKANNQLEVYVSNLMANRIIYMDRNNIPWKIFYNTNMPARRRENAKNGLFNASEWKPLPSGLLGDVTISPLRRQE